MVRHLESRFLAPDLKICRLINGMWQVSGAHGSINQNKAVEDMLQYHNCGLTSWDMADIYGPAETIFGKYRKKLVEVRGEGSLRKTVGFTKFVPRPGPMTRKMVAKAVSSSLEKMNVPSIDAIQFHWWDYDDKNYVDSMRYLTELRDEGMVRHLALTNFDTQRMEELTDAGFKFVSNQVQYSILDQRPQTRMEEFCKKEGIGMLAYGVLAGGLISEQYLNRPEPVYDELDTASLQKYKQVIDVWGGWDLFQQLLGVLADIAKRHGVGIPNIAIRYVLDKPQVAGVIVGAKLGVTEHRDNNLMTFDLSLDSEDTARIDEFSSQGRDLFSIIGDCGDEYR